MKDIVINKWISIIKSNNNFDEIKIAELKYKIEALYLTLSKIIIITILSIILNIFKYYLIFLLLYIPLRSFSFGMHAKKSYQCWIMSPLFFLGIPYLIKIINISKSLSIIIALITALIIIACAPADTVKRPIINPKRRLKFKILTSIVCLIYFIALIILPKYQNYFMFVLLYQAFIVNPLTYKLFGLPYNNYKAYSVNE